jgi:porphobilinogen deaminase
LYSTIAPSDNLPDPIPEVGSAVCPSGRLPVAVKVFAGLIDTKASVRTWYAIRSFDFNGSGFALINVKELAKYLSVTAQTIYAHLADSNLFPIVNRAKNGFVRIFYKSLVKVAYSLGIECAADLGAYTEFLPQWLGDRMRCAVYATEMQTQEGQRQAYYKAEKAGKKNRKTGKSNYEQLIDPNVAVKQLSKNEKRIKRGLRRSKVLTGLNSNATSTAFRFYRIRLNQAVPSISQLAIALKMKRSRATIQNRLRNKNRARWGIELLNRRRVIREFAPDVEKRMGEYLDHIGSNFAAIKLEESFVSHVGRIKIGEEQARPYQLLTNIYEFSFELLPGKRVREKLNRLAKRIRDNA